MTGPLKAVLPYSFAKRHGIVASPVGQGMTLYHMEKISPTLLAEVQRHYTSPLNLVQVTHQQYQEQLTLTYEERAGAAESLADTISSDIPLEDAFSQALATIDLLDQADDAPIIRLINALLSAAINRKASDIHVEPFEDEVSIRLRVDGTLHAVLQPPRKLAAYLISRLKVMARLDIAEKRVPQDGRASIRLGKHQVDIRVSTMPTMYGERVVLRLLDKTATVMEFSYLGMGSTDEERFRQGLGNPHGIILVTGPTGSGKTTTLYTALSHLNDGTSNILTIEDPVEYELKGIGQSQVNAKAGMTFARGLRAILRQDPDVVMIGEIRDAEAAGIAIQASLTGHLVLSTLHTNTAIGAVTRLVDMGLEPFLLSSTLKMLVAQRLLRRLCEHCKTATLLSASLRARLDIEPQQYYGPVGCTHCHGSGYDGRVAIYEIVAIDDELQESIHRQESESCMTEIARRHAPSLKQAGLEKLRLGETSAEEVLRVVFS